MPLLRLNADVNGIAVHNSPACATRLIGTSAHGTGPAIIMVHGFKYDPFDPAHCPHDRIFSLSANQRPYGHVPWPRSLGFGQGNPNEGLAIAFAWRARGALWHAQAAARAAGVQLARVIARIKAQSPRRAVHVVTHSMGSEVLFEALHHLPAGSIARALVLTAASYHSRAEAALATDAGRTTELFNITSRENDAFDFVFERLIHAPVVGDRAMGCGVQMGNVVNIEIDCLRALRTLRAFGGDIAAPCARVCHWSAYTRPGVMQFYETLLRTPDAVPLPALRAALPKAPTKRWARLLRKSPHLALNVPNAA